MPSCNIAVIGGGIVGVTLARELAQRFPDILLIEKESRLAAHTSGHNSGVLHSGINPRPGTLKARLCVEGNQLLRRYCSEKGVPHEVKGTLIMARDDSQIPLLHALKARADNNGVPDIQIMSPEQYQEHEPHAIGSAALYSPTGGIVDSVALTQSLASEAQARGVTVIFDERILNLKEGPSSIELNGTRFHYNAKLVINCAGLQADRLAHSLGVAREYTTVPFRGEYLVIKPMENPVVRSMIYALPDLRYPFLGVHLTKTTSGKVLIGPNAVLALGRESYKGFQLSLRDLWEMITHKGFWNMVRRHKDLVATAWNELQNSYRPKHFLAQAAFLARDLHFDDLAAERSAGIRAQLVGDDGELVDDLVIESTPHSIHVLNVVSPGMTSSMAFAKWFSQNLDADGRWQEKRRVPH